MEREFALALALPKDDASTNALRAFVGMSNAIRPTRRLRRARHRSRRALALGARPPQRAGQKRTIRWSGRLLGGITTLAAASYLPRLVSVPVAATTSRAPGGVARDRYATLDPGDRSPGIGAYEEDGGRAGGSSGGATELT